ncbi:hypothetical protein Pla86_08180 [Planctomycetes bacterium Pla86]|uniref:DUF4328 domain-containing protein n=2 Tax=Engelhardtia mirabilis TaxID=2528011 RepID=A0A518BFQ8_9BACT|nr:hypothetical protein Pla133_08190 [Planctomycetes bacterium Pla133]QDV00079.1 hypothetical protein Pla86_08180 [Planctomycetes bacterium Pla86]
MPSLHAVRDLRGLTKALLILLSLDAAVSIVAAASSLMQAQLMGLGYLTQAQAEANDLREGLIALVWLVTFLATVVAFCRWIFVANKNVRALGARGLRASPGWAVGSFFVPIASLWIPFQAMKELWLASYQPADWRGGTTAGLVRAWWAAWLVNWVLANVSQHWMDAADHPAAMASASYFQAFVKLFEVLLCLAAGLVVSRITAAQVASADALRASEEAGG